MEAPIIYEVDRARDGGSFSVRRIVAIQHGRPIFNMAASFHIEEDGLTHQSEMPKVEGPENFKNLNELMTDEVINHQNQARIPNANKKNTRTSDPRLQI